MSSSTKKMGPAGYFHTAAAVLGIVGIGTMVYSSAMDQANAIHSLPRLIVQGIIAVLAVCLAVWAPTHKEENSLIGFVGILAAIALFTANIGAMINERILMIAGLFSYNAGNTAGWHVFYVMIASIVCFVAAIIAMIIGSFLKSSK